MLPSQQGRSSFFDDSAKTPPKRRPGSKARDGASPLIWGWLYPSLTRLFTWGWLSLTRVAQWSWLTLTRVTQWVRGNPKRRGALLLAAAGLLSLLLFWTPHIGHSNASAAAQLKGGQAASSQRTEQLPVSKRVASLAARLLDPSAPERQLKDQVYLGKAYLAQAQIDNNEAFAASLEQWIQSSESFLASSMQHRRKLGSGERFVQLARTYIGNMSVLLLQAREFHYDSAETMNKLRDRLAAIEAKLASSHNELAAVAQVAAESVPRSILCLSISLGSKATGPNHGPVVIQEAKDGALVDPSLNHFAIFSDNILALAVAVNSTVSSALSPQSLVFHVITDAVTFSAVKTWFSLHPPGRASMEVVRLEDFPWLNAANVVVLKQIQDPAQRRFYFSTNTNEEERNPSDLVKFHNPKYLSLLNHGRFYLPRMFPALSRMVLLDDDVVVQRDLGGLFTLDMHGSVNGAVETCLGQFHRFRTYLNFSDPRIASRFDPEGCGWAFGMNVFDFVAWRATNITDTYHFWQLQNSDHVLWKLGTLPVGLLTFYGLTRPIDRMWHNLGLGYNKRLNVTALSSAAVLHWNGNLKPWLKIAIPAYRPFWTKFLNFNDPDLVKCGFA